MRMGRGGGGGGGGGGGEEKENFDLKQGAVLRSIFFQVLTAHVFHP